MGAATAWPEFLNIRRKEAVPVVLPAVIVRAQGLFESAWVTEANSEETTNASWQVTV